MSHHGERQWNKAQHFDAEATRRGIEREGDCLCLRRGVTLRDEMGRTNTRNRELVTSTRWARKTLVIDRIGSALESAHLCPYIGGPADASTLCIDLNGHAVEISLPEPEYWSGAWKRIPLPVEHLREGENEVVFRAVEDAEWRLLMENGFLPDRSAVSDDAGQTWRSDEIGENDRGDGEYVVRLWLDQYAEEGEIISSPVDLLAIAAGQIIAAAGKVTNIELALDADLPANPAPTSTKLRA